MNEPAKNPKVDAFLEREKHWRPEYEKLRRIVLDCGLTEELKWGQPCYTEDGKNVVLIHGFNDYCALLFVKGALLKDDAGILIQQTENVQSARQARFASVGEIAARENVLKAYIHAAIEVEKAGLQVKKKSTAEFDMADELKAALHDDAAFKAAFEALTPGRQRGYILFFSGAKQAKTREERIAKHRSKILAGKGLDDD